MPLDADTRTLVCAVRPFRSTLSRTSRFSPLSLLSPHIPFLSALSVFISRSPPLLKLDAVVNTGPIDQDLVGRFGDYGCIGVRWLRGVV